jgi:replicative DNA helicase
MQPIWTANMSELISVSVANIRDRYENKHALLGLDTGFDDLNAMTGGLLPGTLTIIGGRPSMGKTALTLNIVRKIAVEQNLATMIVSYEDSKEQTSQRLLLIGAQVDANRLRTGHMSESDWAKLNAEAEQLKNSPIFVEDKHLSVEELRARCQKIKAAGVDLKLLVIDHIQLLPRPDIELANSEDGVTTARRLKRLAVDLNIAIIANSPLSRALESRRNKRPLMSDLGHGATDGDAADLVLFLYRDEYYDPESEYRGNAELIIAKQRYGPVGTIELNYLSNTGVFTGKVYSHMEVDSLYSSENLNQIWSESLKLIAKKVPEATYVTWISPIRLIAINHQVVKLAVDNDFARTFINGSLANVIREALQIVIGKNISLKVVADKSSRMASSNKVSGRKNNADDSSDG